MTWKRNQDVVYLQKVTKPRGNNYPIYLSCCMPVLYCEKVTKVTAFKLFLHVTFCIIILFREIQKIIKQGIKSILALYKIILCILNTLVFLFLQCIEYKHFQFISQFGIIFYYLFCRFTALR